MDKIDGNVSTFTTTDISLFNCVRGENSNLFSLDRKIKSNKISLLSLSLNELTLICYKLSKGVEMIGKEEARHILKGYYEEFSHSRKVSIYIDLDRDTKYGTLGQISDFKT